MRILLTGATGFIGRHLAIALRLAGHEVLCVVRDPQRACRELQGFSVAAIDFSSVVTAADWGQALQNIDAVINAVGIFREQGTQTFAALHEQAPIALFEACLAKRVPRVIQISALGAADAGGSAFLDSKRRADEFLLNLPLAGVVLQPAPIFGVGGASASLFARLATLPMLGLPAAAQPLQPVHIDDICTAVLQLLQDWRTGRIAAVGPQAVTLREYIASLRAAMGYRPAVVFTVSNRLIAAAHNLSRSDWLAPETLQLFEQSRLADPAPFQQLLRRAAIPPADFVNDADRWRRNQWVPPMLTLLRWSMAALWIVTGIISLFVFPIDQSIELLARSGFGPPLALPLLITAALLDIAFGLAILQLRRGRRLLWLAQGAVILGYSAIISLRMPEFWAHPYGAILKNVPILAAIAVLYVFEPRRGKPDR